MSSISAAQYAILVEYMECNGDLMRPQLQSQGKLMAIMKWEQLSKKLNEDGSGPQKTVKSWKKVWSDLKGRVKKKLAVARAHAMGTGGGPATDVILSDIEKKVVAIIGERQIIGGNCQEYGLQVEQRTATATVASRSFLPPLVRPPAGNEPPPVVPSPAATPPPENLYCEEDLQIEYEVDIIPSPRGQHPTQPTQNVTPSPTRDIPITTSPHLTNAFTPSPRARNDRPARGRTGSMMRHRRVPNSNVNEAAEIFARNERLRLRYENDWKCRAFRNEERWLALAESLQPALISFLNRSCPHS